MQNINFILKEGFHPRFYCFPKKNSGRDVMIDSPSVIADEQLDELGLKVVKSNQAK
ncbi:MAG TPA: hypothetical protein VIN10_08205 [Bacteroidales bacterium]